jgi:hypothetical protein
MNTAGFQHDDAKTLISNAYFSLHNISEQWARQMVSVLFEGQDTSEK